MIRESLEQVAEKVARHGECREHPAFSNKSATFAMAGYSVSPGLMQEAKLAIDAGVAHYRAVAADFANMRMGLLDADAFEGGYGLEGHFRDGLVAFGDAWTRKIDEFIQDEWAFATFLEGFSARIEGTHKLYQDLEMRTAQLFDGIGEQLGGDR